MEKLAPGLKSQLKDWKEYYTAPLTEESLRKYFLSIFKDRAAKDNVVVQVWFSSKEDANKWFKETWFPLLKEDVKKALKEFKGKQ